MSKQQKQRKRVVRHMKDLPSPSVHFKNGYVYIRIQIPMERLEYRIAKKLKLL